MKNNKNKILEMYFVKKIIPSKIAEKLGISKSAVTQTLQKDERYMSVKRERIEENQQKHKEYTQNYIKNKRKEEQFKNKDDDLILRNMHNQASSELSERKRTTNLAYRDWNKSAYNYNKQKKRFEFKEELGRSYDVPKYIKVDVR